LITSKLNLFSEIITVQVGGQGGGFISMILPFALIFGIFYFLVILPQKKQQKKHAEMISQLQKGDNILLNSGIKGRISEVKELDFKVEIAPKVVITVTKNVVSGKVAGQTVENEN
jgi:preprotein translocase subunit YajC